MTTPRRLYRDVAVQAMDDGFAVLLDGKAMKTPAGGSFQLPTRALAEAVAEEWRQQGPKPRSATMGLTKLCNTSLDKVRPNRDTAIEQILAFGGTDLVCYRADSPAELVRRQALAWDPLLKWLHSHYGVALCTVSQIAFVLQGEDALAAFRAAISARDDFTVAALSAVAALTGSLTIALGFVDRYIDAAQALNAANVDDIYQEERWGKDEEMTAKTAAKQRELSAISRFLELLAQ